MSNKKTSRPDQKPLQNALNMNVRSMSDLSVKSMSVKTAAELGGVKKHTAPPSPLDDVAMTGKLETDSVKEVDAFTAALRAKDKRYAKQFQAITDSRYWVALCFQSNEQRLEFLAACGIPDDQYVDGLAIARKLGIQITAENPKYPKPRISKVWSDLT